MSYTFLQGDSVDLPFDDKSVDLVFCSPPYEAARTYGIDFKLKGEDWVKWAVERFKEHLRVCRGLVAWVVEGQTRNYQWSAAPAMLMADLHRAGVRLRKPPAFHRVGIPGSGGPDWLRNDYEFIVCATHGKLPWSNNTAMGHPPRWPVGGAMSNRKTSGKRVIHPRGENGEMLSQGYDSPAVVNPGNCIKTTYTCDEVATLLSEAGDFTHHNAGGGVMGDKICHENEAPFPESLAEFFIRSFCPPDGVVLDPFSGSGTTVATAVRWGRNGIGMDIRESQVALGNERLAKIKFGDRLAV